MAQGKEGAVSREKILGEIRKNRPPFVAPPVFPSERFGGPPARTEAFVGCVESVGGSVIRLRRRENLSAWIQKTFPDAVMVISLARGAGAGTLESRSIPSARELDNLDLAVLDGEFGVAENGAVWIPETHTGHRSVPFIAAHVVIVLEEERIVDTMHDAMARLAGFSEGFGVFVSGPSKTADIEQSLVIGAQGPLSLTVALVNPGIIPE